MKWLAKELAPSTKAEHEKNLAYFKNWLEDQHLSLEILRYEDLLRYIENLKHLKTATINNRLQTIKKYLDYLTDQKLLLHNPAGKLILKSDRQKLKNYLDKEVIDQLYQSYNAQYPNTTPAKVLLGFICFQGADTGICKHLLAKDIDFNTGTISFPETRRFNARTLPIIPAQMMALFAFSQTLQPDQKPFPGSLTNLTYSLTNQIKKLEPQVNNLQHIRASMVNYWLQHHNLRQVQYMAGHRYISSTEQYRTVDLEALKSELERFHPLETLR